MQTLDLKVAGRAVWGKRRGRGRRSKGWPRLESGMSVWRPSLAGGASMYCRCGAAAACKQSLLVRYFVGHLCIASSLAILGMLDGRSQR